MQISALLVRCFLAELKRRSVDVPPLLEVARIRPYELADSRARIGADRVEALLAASDHVLRGAALGVHVGANSPSHALHVFSHLAVASSTLGDALEGWRVHGRNLLPALQVRLWERGQLAYLSLEIATEHRALRRVGTDALMVGALRYIRHFSGGDVKPEVWLHRAAPSRLEPYRAAFRCPILFSAGANVILFAREALQAELPSADPMMLRFLDKLALDWSNESIQRGDIAERVRTLLRADGPISGSPSKVAAKLGVRPRTLRRRLSTHGVSLTSLLDEARREQACRALSSGERVGEIASQLGYSDHTAFYRAFKRWTGKTPKQFLLVRDS